MRARPRRRQHQFVAAPGLREDVAGGQYCATCGLPQANASHVPPDPAVLTAAREYDERRTGEKDMR
jgi:hypothetical protein